MVCLDDRFDPVGGEHLQRRALCRAGDRVGILAHEERAGNVLRRAVLADRLGDGQNMRLVEGAVERAAAMAAGAEAHLLRRIVGVGFALVVGLARRR